MYSLNRCRASCAALTLWIVTALSLTWPSWHAVFTAPSLGRKMKVPPAPRIKGAQWSMRKVRGALVACAVMVAAGIPQQLLAAALHNHKHDALASVLLLAHGRRLKAPPLGNDYELTHRGPATLPTHTSDYVSSNDLTGVAHSPANANELQSLLAGGTLSGSTLQAGDSILYDPSVTYNSYVPGSYVPTQYFGYIDGMESAPIRNILASPGLLPAPGERIIPATHRRATSTFQLKYNTLPAIQISDGAKGWQFIGMQLDIGTIDSTYWMLQIGTPTDGIWDSGTAYAAGQKVYFTNGITQTGPAPTFASFPVYVAYVSLHGSNTGNNPYTSPSDWRLVTVADLPDKTVFDRCDLSCNVHNVTRNTVYMEFCAEILFTGNHLWNEGKVGGEECKAIGGVTLSGKIIVENNTLAAPGEAMILGGAEPAIYGLNPTQVIWRRNLFTKPLRWNNWHPSWDGLYHDNLKNQAELKAAIEALIEDNQFKYGWNAGTSQIYDLVVKVTSTGAGALNETRDVTIRSNKFTHTQGPFAIGARDAYGGVAVPLAVRNISIYECYSDTLVADLPAAYPPNYMMQFHRSIDGLHLENLTFLGDPATLDRICWLDDTNQSTTPNNWTWRNLILSSGQYGLGSDGGYCNGINYFTRGTGSSASHIYMFGNGISSSFIGATYPDPPFIFSDTANDFVTNYAGLNFATAAALTNAGYAGRTPGVNKALVDYRTRGCETGVWT